MQLQVVLRISRELGGRHLLSAFMVMPGNMPLCAGGGAISFVSFCLKLHVEVRTNLR
jgi:hypothetical protein